MMPRRCAARNSSTVSSGVACQNRAIDSGRMLRKATIGACSRNSASLGARPWLAGSRARSAISVPRRRQRGRFRGFTRDGAGKMVRRFQLADHPLDGAEALVAFAPDLPGQLRQQSQHAEALELGGEDHPASGALRINLGRGNEAAERAVDEMAGLRQAAVLLPLAELLLPFHPYRTVFDAGEAVDAAVSIGTLLDLVCRHAGDLVDARAVRDKGPDRLRRLGEVPFLAVAIDALHAQHFQTGRCESRQRRKYVKAG